METDPVCSMQIAPERAAARVEDRGKTYYFCCQGCQRAFAADPQKYIAPAHSSRAAHHHGQS
ncbi:MAG: YHS domain-containing protein [Betaproteobacteria bacterium]|nr:YHS domain-containing protein [Betaproteobacteria bacterium]